MTAYSFKSQIQNYIMLCQDKTCFQGLRASGAEQLAGSLQMGNQGVRSEAYKVAEDYEPFTHCVFSAATMLLCQSICSMEEVE